MLIETWCILSYAQKIVLRGRERMPQRMGCESQFTICSNVNVIFVCLSSICRLAATCETYLSMCKCSSKTFKPYTASYCFLTSSILPCILLHFSFMLVPLSAVNLQYFNFYWKISLISDALLDNRF